MAISFDSGVAKTDSGTRFRRARLVRPNDSLRKGESVMPHGTSATVECITTSAGHKLSTQALTKYGITSKADITAFSALIDRLYEDLIAVPGRTDKQIMKHELVAALAKLLLRNDYELTGNDVEQFKEALNAGEGQSLVWASYNDGAKSARRLSKIVVGDGGKWRVQHDPEYEAAKSQLIGDNWTPIGTKHANHKGRVVFLRLASDGRRTDHPGFRCAYNAVRLVWTRK